MATIDRSRLVVFGIATLFAFALGPRDAVDDHAQTLAEAPTSASRGEISDDGSVQTSRTTSKIRAAPGAMTNPIPSDVAWAPSGGTGSALILRHGLWPADLASGRCFLQSSDVIKARVWTDTSCYGVAEASRAAAAALLARPAAADRAATDCPPGTVIQTLTVPADRADVPTTSLDRGQPYQLRASGVLLWGTPDERAEDLCLAVAPSPQYCAHQDSDPRGDLLMFATLQRHLTFERPPGHSAAPKPGVLAMVAGYLFFAGFSQGADPLDGVDAGLALMGSVGERAPSATWGAFTDTHVYEQDITGTGAALALRLHNPGSWERLTGALTVQIACA
jgi:hypothetical protein